MSATVATVEFVTKLSKLPGEAVDTMVTHTNQALSLKPTWSSSEVQLLVLQAAVEAMRVITERVKHL